VSAEAEADVGFLGQGEVVGIENEGEGLEAGQRREAGGHRLGWNVPGTGNIIKVKDRRGEWQTKVVSVIPEMERYPSKVIADVVRFRPRTNREVLAPVHRLQTC
jgi:hypothetical protein